MDPQKTDGLVQKCSKTTPLARVTNADPKKVGQEAKDSERYNICLEVIFFINKTIIKIITPNKDRKGAGTKRGKPRQDGVVVFLAPHAFGLTPDSSKRTVVTISTPFSTMVNGIHLSPNWRHYFVERTVQTSGTASTTLQQPCVLGRW